MTSWLLTFTWYYVKVYNSLPWYNHLLTYCRWYNIYSGNFFKNIFLQSQKVWINVHYFLLLSSRYWYSFISVFISVRVLFQTCKRNFWGWKGTTDSIFDGIFFNLPLIISDDVKHSNTEKKFYVLGKSQTGRLLFISFTIRNNLIRVISARGMNRNERKIYEEKIDKELKKQA